MRWTQRDTNMCSPAILPARMTVELRRRVFRHFADTGIAAGNSARDELAVARCAARGRARRRRAGIAVRESRSQRRPCRAFDRRDRRPRPLSRAVPGGMRLGILALLVGQTAARLDARRACPSRMPTSGRARCDDRVLVHFLVPARRRWYERHCRVHLSATMRLFRDEEHLGKRRTTRAAVRACSAAQLVDARRNVGTAIAARRAHWTPAPLRERMQRGPRGTSRLTRTSFWALGLASRRGAGARAARASRRRACRAGRRASGRRARAATSSARNMPRRQLAHLGARGPAHRLVRRDDGDLLAAAVLGREPLDQRVRVRRPAHARAGRAPRPGRGRRRRARRARPCRRPSSRAGRAARPATRSRPRAGG